MSLETGKIILKQSYENDSSGIINDLSEENGKPKSYARGNFNLVSSEEQNTSEENTSNLPYYSSENIASIYKNSYFIKNVDQNAICKSNIYSFNKEDLLNGTTDTKDSDKDFSVLTAFANFNDLSTMVVNAYLPLTNIRLAEFHIVNRINDGPLEPTSSVVNVFLTDKSISGTHEKNLSAINNINDNSKEIIGRDNFFDKGGVLDSVNALKTNLKISESYNDNENDIINFSTYDALNNICLNALNNIRVNLSCRFEDYLVSDYWKLKRKLTYNSSSSQEKTVVEYENYLYTRFTISSFDDIFGSYPNYTDYIPTDDNGQKLTFVGWTKDSESTTTVDYVKGDGLILDNDYNLYPIFKKYYNVIYHYNYNKDNNKFSASITYTVECGKSHRILDYDNFAHSGLPDGVSFIGWTTKSNENTLASSDVEYKSGETITKGEITTINLYAVGYKKEWKSSPSFSTITVPSNHVNIGHGYGNFYSTPTKLNTILTYCTQKGIKLPSINYLVGILCFTKQTIEDAGSADATISANCTINNTKTIIKDRMGSTSRSTAYGIVIWKPLDVELSGNYTLEDDIANYMKKTVIPSLKSNSGVSTLTTIDDNNLSESIIKNIKFSGVANHRFFYSLENLYYINKEKSIDPKYSYL